MEIKGINVPLGLSAGHCPAEKLADYAAAGFTHFELVIPYRLPDPNPLARTPEQKKTHPYTKEECRLISCTGKEELLTAQVAHKAAALTRLGIRPWSIHLPFGAGWDISHFDEEDRALAVEKLKRIIDLTEAWGASVYVLHGCLEPVAEADRETRIRHSIQSLREIAAYLALRGKRLALENLPRSCLGNNTPEMERMSREAGVGICFDVNHLLTDSHKTFLDALEDRIITLHLSDYDGINERHWNPGEGTVPWGLLFDRLTAAGYRGPWLFELAALPEPKILAEMFGNAVSAFLKEGGAKNF